MSYTPENPEKGFKFPCLVEHYLRCAIKDAGDCDFNETSLYEAITQLPSCEMHFGSIKKEIEHLEVSTYYYTRYKIESIKMTERFAAHDFENMVTFLNKASEKKLRSYFTKVIEVYSEEFHDAMQMVNSCKKEVEERQGLLKHLDSHQKAVMNHQISSMASYIKQLQMYAQNYLDVIKSASKFPEIGSTIVKNKPARRTEDEHKRVLERVLEARNAIGMADSGRRAPRKNPRKAVPTFKEREDDGVDFPSFYLWNEEDERLVEQKYTIFEKKIVEFFASYESETDVFCETDIEHTKLDYRMAQNARDLDSKLQRAAVLQLRLLMLYNRNNQKAAEVGFAKSAKKFVGKFRDFQAKMLTKQKEMIDQLLNAGAVQTGKKTVYPHLLPDEGEPYLARIRATIPLMERAAKLSVFAFTEYIRRNGVHEQELGIVRDEPPYSDAVPGKNPCCSGLKYCHFVGGSIAAVTHFMHLTESERERFMSHFIYSSP